MKINKILPQEAVYLQQLCTIADCPKSLYYIGKLPGSPTPTVAIVGSRKTTPYGIETAEQLAYGLAKRGVIVISGLALGIDAAAHRGALRAGGITIAVLAHGLDNIYPTSNRALASELLKTGGAIISDYPPGMPAMAHQFLARNRIVSGLSSAVIIVEAATRSGALNTAAQALDQAKDVYAVPGNITSELSAGCNLLIAQGATPVTSIEACVTQITGAKAYQQVALPMGDNAAETVLIELMSRGTSDGEDLLARSELDISSYNQTLSMLEIKGIARALGGNHWGIR